MKRLFYLHKPFLFQYAKDQKAIVQYKTFKEYAVGPKLGILEFCLFIQNDLPTKDSKIKSLPMLPLTSPTPTITQNHLNFCHSLVLVKLKASALKFIKVL